MQPVSHKYQNQLEKGQSRTEFLYYTKYKRECKREGLTGQKLRKEGIRRANQQVRAENKAAATPVQRRVVEQVEVNALPKPNNKLKLVKVIKCKTN